jgi:hypothetical protein
MCVGVGMKTPDILRTTATAVCGVAGLALLASGVAPALAGAATPAFGKAQTLAAAGVPSLSPPPAVATNADGESVVAWLSVPGKTGRLLVRRGDAAGHFGKAQTLTTSPMIGPSVSIAADGAAAVTWQALSGGKRKIEVAIARPGHGFGAAQTLASVSEDVVSTDVVAQAHRTVAVWGQDLAGGNAGEVRYAVAGASDHFAAARTLAPAYLVPEVDASAAAAGDVIVAYKTPVSTTPQENSQVASAALPPTGTTFGAPQVVSAGTAQSLPDSEADGASLSAGPGGVALSYGIEGVLPWDMQVTTFADGAFGTPQTVGQVPNPPPGLNGYMGPVVAVPASGGQVAAWTPSTSADAEGGNLTSAELEVAVQQPDGSFAPPVQLTAGSTLSQYPVAAATTDLSIVVWTDGSFDSGSLKYTLHSAGGFSTVRTLGGDVLRNAALAAAGRRAIVVWISGHALRYATLHG